MDVDEGIALFGKAFEKAVEERVWQKWLAFYVHTDKDKRLPYDVYYKKHVNKPNNSKARKKTPEEIIEKSKRIRELDKRS